MPKEPQAASNRRGCFIILGVLLLFLFLYLFVGLSASPGNNVAQDIQTVSR